LNILAINPEPEKRKELALSAVQAKMTASAMEICGHLGGDGTWGMA
jgi:hypothetical protein